MSEENKISAGAIGWIDLTVTNADEVLTFYKEVVGWTSEGLEMKDGDDTYADHVMKDASGNAVAGICHLRGVNADLPPEWIMYVPVVDVEASVEKCTALGGEVLKRMMNEDGSIAYVVIKDPAGAVMALTPT